MSKFFNLNDVNNMNDIVYDDDALSNFAPKFKAADDSLALDSTPPRKQVKKIKKVKSKPQDAPVVEVIPPKQQTQKMKKKKKVVAKPAPIPEQVPVSVPVKKVVKKKKIVKPPAPPMPTQKRESTPAPGRRSATPNQIDVDISVIEDNQKHQVETRGRSPSVFIDNDQIEKLKMELAIAQKERELETIRAQETQTRLLEQIQLEKSKQIYQTPSKNTPEIQKQSLEIENLRTQLQNMQNPNYLQNIIKQELNRQQQQKISFLQTDTTYCVPDQDLKPAKPSDMSIFENQQNISLQQKQRPKQHQHQPQQPQTADISIGPSIYHPTSKEVENQEKMLNLQNEILQLKKDQVNMQQRPQEIIQIVEALKPKEGGNLKLKTELSAYMQEIKNLNEQQFLYQKQIQNELRTSQISQENQSKLDREKMEIEKQRMELQRQQYEFQLKQQEALERHNWQQQSQQSQQQMNNGQQFGNNNNNYNQLISTFAHTVNAPKRQPIGQTLRFLMADMLQ